MKFLRYLLVSLVVPFLAQSQKSFTIRTIAFYNVENLFDTVNDTLVFDDERTPEGSYHWNQKRYDKKIEHISKVLSEIGMDVTETSPDVIGLCEVENRQVLDDLINHPNLQDKEYGIVHFDSPDRRGIDVALLYKKAAYLPTSFKSHRLLLFDGIGERIYTRDQLVVGGVLDDEALYFIVNHWPSRRGGSSKSKPNRVKAALLNKRIIDSIQKLHWDAKIISMGDLNDDPRDDSLKKILKTSGKATQLDSLTLFNPMERLYKKGLGSLAYRDKWNLFDQFFMTSNLIHKSEDVYFYWKAGIFSPDYLKTSDGKFKGYLFRTYSGTSYTGGYSDHFPVYLFLIKEANH
ncbi:endonuclease/exonuclease/phosphatase family protein [Flagellimonas sp. HMM57]|uniref:endonuclease/exonuclease/phosphatase family protein n=1 Tax=unclassified Flagellimonas TaxID=2644544 RepID=UPI0013D0BEF2|nr:MULTISPECIES: endonuclease/exonuclease/phosphatase family protein [unclassified Flagellimonas]UII77923.1 endonuclease/exonuclease/phosphatase family protein [Flagellimonas sp. HMM57]